MGTHEQQNCMKGTIPNTITKMAENQRKLSAPENTSCSEHGNATLCLFGENSLMAADNKESTVPSSAMRVPISHLSLSGRLTPLLISAGLVRGIIPMSMRTRSDQLTLGIVLKPQGGENAE